MAPFDAVKLTTVRADRAGAFEVDVTIPIGMDLGSHHIRALGTTSQVEATVPLALELPTLASSTPGSLATGLPQSGLETAPLIALGGGLLVAGLAITWLRRSRTRRQQR